MGRALALLTIFLAFSTNAHAYCDDPATIRSNINSNNTYIQNLIDNIEHNKRYLNSLSPMFSPGNPADIRKANNAIKGDRESLARARNNATSLAQDLRDAQTCLLEERQQAAEERAAEVKRQADEASAKAAAEKKKAEEIAAEEQKKADGAAKKKHDEDDAIAKRQQDYRNARAELDNNTRPAKNTEELKDHYVNQEDPCLLNFNNLAPSERGAVDGPRPNTDGLQMLKDRSKAERAMSSQADSSVCSKCCKFVLKPKSAKKATKDEPSEKPESTANELSGSKSPLGSCKPIHWVVGSTSKATSIPLVLERYDKNLNKPVPGTDSDLCQAATPVFIKECEEAAAKKAPNFVEPASVELTADREIGDKNVKLTLKVYAIGKAKLVDCLNHNGFRLPGIPKGPNGLSPEATALQKDHNLATP